MGYWPRLDHCRARVAQIISDNCLPYLRGWRYRMQGWRRRASFVGYQGMALLVARWPKYQLPAFLLLFFAIWHPGLHNPCMPQDSTSLPSVSFAIPQRPHIYPVENIVVKLGLREKWLSLSMQGKTVAAFPLRNLRLPSGTYFLTSLQAAGADGLVGYMETHETKVAICTRAVSATQFFIELDEDFWEMVYPYLRASTPVYIE